MSTQETCSLFSGSCCRQYASTLLIVILGAAISIAVFFVAYSWERSSIRREFDSLAEDRLHAISNKVDDSADLLHFADNAFLVGPRADSPEFLNYVRSLTAVIEADLSQYPAVRAMIWMPRVPRAERAAFERATQTIFEPTSQLSNPGTSPNAGSDHKFEENFPSYLCIAATSNRDQPCEDLARDPAEWKEMERARDTGLIIASAPISMSADPNGRLGYRLFQPLYHDVPKDIASRRQTIASFLSIDLDIGESVAKAFKGIPPVGIDVWVFDDANGKLATIYRHASRLEPPTAGGDEKDLGDELELTSTVEFYGRKLLLRCRTTPAFWNGHTIWQPWVLLCVGLILTLTLAGYRLSLAVHASAIERTLETRMTALRKDIEQRQKAK